MCTLEELEDYPVLEKIIYASWIDPNPRPIGEFWDYLEAGEFMGHPCYEHGGMLFCCVEGFLPRPISKVRADKHLTKKLFFELLNNFT